MALIVKYKFQNVDANGDSVSLLPQFPSDVSYTTTDAVEGNITTRTIETDDLSKVTYIRFGCYSDTYVTGAWEYLTEILDINISYVNTFRSMFRGCKILNKIDVSNWNTKNITSTSYMFNACSKLTQLDVSNWDTKNVTSMDYMFSNCPQLAQLDVSNWNTGNATNMNSMFRGCSKLTHLDLSNWDTKKVTGMAYMFNNCTQLTQLDVSKFNTSKATNMGSMFKNCNKLAQLDVSNFDTSNVEHMDGMFHSCINLTQLDVSKFNTSKATNMGSMFHSCINLTQLDVSKFNTSKVTNMNGMFSNCQSLTLLDLSNFDTSNVTNMAFMFCICTSLTLLDLSNFDTSKVTDMNGMFEDCGVKNVGLIYCSKDTIDNLASYIDSSCKFYVSNKTYTSPTSLVKYVTYREDKKPLLYYNPTTDTWEKPILREWDSIEKHSDGKYYYHKRSGEAIVDGKNWYGYIERENTVRVARNNIKHIGYNNFITDKYIIQDIYNNDIEGIQGSGTSTELFISINKSKLLEISLDGVSNYLNSNNFVIVYQLAQEEVYECINLDLITYENETNFIVNTGAIVPKTTLKVMCNINNVVRELQQKVSNLENYIQHVMIDALNNALNE